MIEPQQTEPKTIVVTYVDRLAEKETFKVNGLPRTVGKWTILDLTDGTTVYLNIDHVLKMEVK